MKVLKVTFPMTNTNMSILLCGFFVDKILCVLTSRCPSKLLVTVMGGLVFSPIYKHVALRCCV